MTTLYELGETLKQQADSIFEMINQGADPDSTEMQELLKNLFQDEQQWQDKAKNVARFIHQMTADEDMIKQEIERLTAKKKRIERTYSYLQDTLLMQMQNFGIDEIQDPVLPIKVKNNPYSVNVLDVSKVPEKFTKTKTTVEVDKRLLLKERETLEQVDGIEFVRTQRLVIG